MTATLNQSKPTAAQGVIRDKDGKILGRAVIADDGNAMIYTGEFGANRVVLGDGSPAQWSHPIPFMVNALFTRAAISRKKKEPMMAEPPPAPAAAPAPNPASADHARAADIAYMEAIAAGTSPDMLEPDTADKLIAIMERHGDAEAQDLAGRAIDAYQSAAMEATAGIR